MTLTVEAQRFLDLAATGRPRPAIDFALDLRAGGLSLDRLILDVLAPTQEEVGRLWQSNQWSTAQEHASTAVVDGVLGAAALQTPPALPARGTVLVACVEQEYHTVPARMGVERLREDGWEVVFLGASLPAQDLQGFAARTEPDVVVLSCTVPLFLPGAARGIAAVADLGLPVVAAGAGFGETSARADRLGSSGWIGPDSNPTDVLRGSGRPAGPPHQTHVDAVQLELGADDLISGCMAEMFVRMPEMSAYSERQLASTMSDLGNILCYLGLAIDLDEAAVFDRFVSWLAEVLATRRVPPSVFKSSLEIVELVLERAELRRPAEICSSTHRRLLPV